MNAMSTGISRSFDPQPKAVRGTVSKLSRLLENSTPHWTADIWYSGFLPLT